jgi:hypothetical protein
VAKIGQWLAGTLAGLVEVLKAQTRETPERLVIDEVVTGPVDAVTGTAIAPYRTSRRRRHG